MHSRKENAMSNFPADPADRSPLRPSLIDMPSASKIAVLESIPSFESAPATRRLNAKAVRLNILGVQVMDGLQGIMGTGIAAAKGVYFITTVVDGAITTPIVFKGATYQGIENGDMLPVGPGHPDPNAVFNVYLSEAELPHVLAF